MELKTKSLYKRRKIMNQWITAISDFKNRTILRAKLLFAKDEKERKELLVAMGLTYKEGEIDL